MQWLDLSMCHSLINCLQTSLLLNQHVYMQKVQLLYMSMQHAFFFLFVCFLLSERAVNFLSYIVYV